MVNCGSLVSQSSNASNKCEQYRADGMDWRTLLPCRDGAAVSLYCISTRNPRTLPGRYSVLVTYLPYPTQFAFLASHHPITATSPPNTAEPSFRSHLGHRCASPRLTRTLMESIQTAMQYSDILILGAGWTATFLIPLLRRHKIPFSATTSDGREVAGSPTARFRFDPSEKNLAEQAQRLSVLPPARHILVTFPLKGEGQSKLLVQAYRMTHGHDNRFIQLGSTGFWKDDPAQKPWLDRTSPYDTTDARAVAEDELRELGGCVLNLSGLWGGERDPKHWVDRVATSKTAVRDKTSLHMIHGEDVARVLVRFMHRFDEEGGWEKLGRGQRWMVTDGFVYDWWSLFAGWADSAAQKDGSVEDGVVEDRYGPSKQAKWVYELMAEEGVRALPRGEERLGRCYDSRELWAMLGIAPLKGGLGL